MTNPVDKRFFETEDVKKIIWKMAPPVMLAQLVQALYNIVDSFFVGRYSSDGLTALSIVFPIQLLITALAVGTGVGINTLVAKFNGMKDEVSSLSVRKVGTVVSVFNWILFCVILGITIGPYIKVSTSSNRIQEMSLIYGWIVGLGSIGLFLESSWTKILQAEGNMRRPMIAQIIGAVVNIILDPILIFGCHMGVAGAAVATVIGQILAAIIVFRGGWSGLAKLVEVKKFGLEIYKTGLPTIIMQALYTVYIVGLNLILATFSDAAVTVLGLYYKLQSFLFIPLFGLQNCIVPVLSFNYSAHLYDRCRELMKNAIIFGTVAMSVGTLLFALIPKLLIQIFSNDLEILNNGVIAFRIIGISFIPAVFVLLICVYFQAVGKQKESIIITILRQIVLLVPLAYIFSRFGLTFFWIAFPAAEILTLIVSVFLYRKRSQ